MDWDKYPNFSEDEFKCSHCGECDMDPEFMEMLQDLRIRFGKGMTITSGYRCHDHPNEEQRTRMGKSGSHTTGQAADVLVSGGDAYRLLWLAMQMGFLGIGVNQKGDHSGRFIHLDRVKDNPQIPRPMIWSY
jgi:uncharacterized protein YcbK (DUF882 family)